MQNGPFFPVGDPQTAPNRTPSRSSRCESSPTSESKPQIRCNPPGDV
jgi:hypothetical protein